MNGLMRKFDYERYFEQIKTMPEPIMTSELPKVKLNLKGIREYAKSKGRRVFIIRSKHYGIYVAD